MAKAILVMDDMPECCVDCACGYFERSNPELNLICGATGEDANNIGRPDWCPLQDQYSDGEPLKHTNIDQSGSVTVEELKDMIQNNRSCTEGSSRRLTVRIKRSGKETFLAYTRGLPDFKILSELTREDIGTILQKLAAYEDLGYTPEELRAEIEQRCAIGTSEECRTAMEDQASRQEVNEKWSIYDVTGGEYKGIEKKILPEYYNAVISGSKTFELRKDEDNIQAGDFIVLKEWDGKRYTGRQTWRRAKYVLRDVPEYGLCPGYCIVGW